MAFRDVRTFTERERWERADKVRVAHDVTGMPRLQWFNYEPCAIHPTRQGDCEKCGIEFRRHQRVGVLWLYLAKRGLLGDSVGTGKTAQVAGLIAMCKETGELGINARRAVVVCRPAAVPQWGAQLSRFIPDIHVTMATGTRPQRVKKYQEPWDVLLIGPQMLTSRAGGDMDALLLIDPGLVVYDDIDAMRHHTNKSAWAIKKLCESADRAVGIHGTPLQKRLPELHSFLEPLGGREIFGTERAFRHRYVVSESVKVWNTDDQTGRRVSRSVVKDTNYKNMPEFKRLVAPLVLRRTAGDIDDVTLPTIQPNVVWLEASPEQRERYDQLRAGVLTKIREDGEMISRPAAMAQFMHGWQICSGLATLDGQEQEGSSVKLDWTADKLIDGDLSDEKVVVFINFKPNVSALSSRLAEAGVGHVLMWGNENKPEERYRRQRLFWEDPNCRVLIGTTTIEQSLNLQVARHIIGVDTILNPARMEQLVGRIRRDGSRYGTVYFHQLLLRGTQEDYYLGQLEREQAIADYVWDERSEIFNALSPLQLMQMIAGR